MHTYASLTHDLELSGIRRQDTLLVHSSMKSIGQVEGRADTVLDALSDYLQDEGLLVFPTLTWSNVNAEQPVYSVRDTPSVVGILPELFRQRPGVRRSLHPTHSVAALGRDAEDFVEGHERFDSPAALGSPWDRLRQRRA
ncbi:MAG TPA: AAC(3) family N-acetyltransferase, partial [Lentisphaeria bacterium]|nr:AAC(3) family N-acetyltransferase [Lentisphaeria bacterium]